MTMYSVHCRTGLHLKSVFIPRVVPDSVEWMRLNEWSHQANCALSRPSRICQMNRSTGFLDICRRSSSQAAKLSCAKATHQTGCSFFLMEPSSGRESLGATLFHSQRSPVKLAESSLSQG